VSNGFYAFFMLQALPRAFPDEYLPFIRSFHSSALQAEYSPKAERLYSPLSVLNPLIREAVGRRSAVRWAGSGGRHDEG
jgi:hypothetical protein